MPRTIFVCGWLILGLISSCGTGNSASDATPAPPADAAAGLEDAAPSAGDRDTDATDGPLTADARGDSSTDARSDASADGRLDGAAGVDGPAGVDGGVDAGPGVDGGPCSPGTWATETVDSAGDVGSKNSIAIDSTGRLHVAYWDKTNGDLRYALRGSSGGWTTTTVDSTDNVGGALDVAVDAAGDPHIAYLDQTSSDLKHATRVGSGAWSILVIESAGDVGLAPAIAVDGSGTVHVSYVGGASATPYGAGLRYAYRPVGEAWTVAMNGGGSALHTALAVDAAGVHIVTEIGVAPSQELGMHSRTSPGAAWVLDNTINTPPPGVASLASDSAGGLHASFHHATAANLGYAYKPPSGGWTVTTVGTMDRAGGTNSLALDAANGVHLAYTALGFYGSDFSLRYAYKPASGAWTTSTIAADAGDAAALAISPAGVVHVTFYDNSARDLKHAYLCQ